MVPLYRPNSLSKPLFRLWLILVAVVIGFAVYALYRWLWLDEPLLQHTAVARALFIAFLALLLVGKLIWKKNKDTTNV